MPLSRVRRTATRRHCYMHLAVRRAFPMVTGISVFMGRIVRSGTVPTTDDATVTFPIGSSGVHEATVGGRLFVFANDRDGYYWNNWGEVTLSVEVP